MKKIAIINDIHGNLYSLNKVLENLSTESIDYYLFLGDLLTDGPDSNEILNVIKTLPAEVIIGNREESIIKYCLNPFEITAKNYPLFYTYSTLYKENIKYLMKIPYEKVINIENKKIMIMHGSIDNVRKGVYEDSFEIFDELINEVNADIFLFAHTHKYFNSEYKNHLFINSGAINCPYQEKLKSTYGILTIQNVHISYEQREINYSFSEIKSYYQNSIYFKYCYIWSNLILYSIRDGIAYYVEFSKNCDNNKTYEENFKALMSKYNLEIIYP